MNENTVIAYGNVVRALIRAMGMQAENDCRAHRGEAPAYGEQAFLDMIDWEGAGSNAVIHTLRG